jgi:AraC-like DNA-binding protein
MSFDYRKDRTYIGELNRAIDRIFEEGEKQGLTLGQMATAARISDTTIHKIHSYETRLPRHSTIFGLARSVGMQIALTDGAASPSVKIFKPKHSGPKITKKKLKNANEKRVG